MPTEMVMPGEMISILDGSTFAVSNRAGDMDAGPDQSHGFFYKDTRHLSRWLLTVNGVAPEACPPTPSNTTSPSSSWRH